MQEKSTSAAAGDDDPYARYRFIGNAFALIVGAASIAEIIANARHPTSRDFLGMWSAARLALAGTPWLAYDGSALHAVEAATATFGNAVAQLPFPYPPAYLLLVLPFAFVPFPLGMALWVLSTFIFYVFAARLLLPRSGWLAAAFPAVFATAAIGQNGFLMAGLFMLGLALLGKRPFVAGLVLGCLVLKPQLALLLPIALIAGRQWRAIGGACVSAIAILLMGVAVFGPATALAWLHEGPLIVQVTSEGLMGWPKLASLYGSLRELGLGAAPAIAVHLVVAGVAAVLVWRVWRRGDDALQTAGVLGAATMLISPYLFFYDGLVAVPAFFALAHKGRSPLLLLALWLLSLAGIVQLSWSAPINVNPLVPIALLILNCR